MNMKAAWYEQQGAAKEVLHLGTMPIPQIEPNEVLIKLHTSGINPSDVKKRQGIRENMQYPRIIPHSDGAGMIEKVGNKVLSHDIGQRVWVYNARWGRALGTAAEFVAVPAHLAIPLPSTISFEVGACLGIPAFTAHRCVFGNGSVKGKTILVTGGAGAVGYYAIQFAKWGGATVISTVSTDEKADYAKTAGADYIVNYRNENVIERIKKLTDNMGVDHIVDVDFGGNLKSTQEIIALNGFIAAYASEGDPNPLLPFYHFLFKGVTFSTVNVYELPDTVRTHAINDITSMLESGTLIPIISQQFPLDQIISAHEAVEKGTKIGNVILKIAS